MDKIPLYTYMAYYQANPIGVTLYNEKEQEMGRYIGTDIIDGSIFVDDGSGTMIAEIEECFVIDYI
jgi:hypothetical protein